MLDPPAGHQRYYIFLLLFTLPLYSSSLTDREILNAFYDATSGDDWDRGWDTWRDPDTTICEWEGVTCTDDEDDEKVASITLSKNKLKGEVPMTLLLQLSDLRDLTLDDNDVTFPSQIKEDDLLDENKNAIESELRELNLGDTNIVSLEGIFGKADGSGVAVRMDKLRVLKLGDVGIDGPFPSQILKLTNLRELDLSTNNLEGSLPGHLSSLSKLKSLDLSDNDFTGEIPDNIGNLDKLEILDLSDNELSGPLKDGIAKLTNMKYLDFEDNELTGPILPLVGMFKLRQVDYSGNNFSGPIPANFLDDINPSDFLTVDLSDNQLDGVIPTDPFKNLKPDTFWIANNKITGIEDTLCNSPAAGSFGCNGILCPPGTSTESGNGNTDDGDCQSCVLAVDYFGSTACNGDDDDDDDDDTDDDNNESAEDDDDDDDDNGIDGDPKQFVRDVLTNFFQSCGGVSWVINTNWGSDLSVCTWQGIACDNPSDESSVTKIRLRGYNIVGNIPNAIFRLPQLTELKLSGNNVMVSLDDIKYAKMLKLLDLSDIGGLIGVGISGAANLEDLSLDSAHLSGPLAAVTELFELRHLKRLSMNHNALTGPIPDSIKNLNQLTYLSMFDNNLSGELPYSLSLLNELSFLNLRENAFSGPLPDYLNQMESLTAINLSEQTHSDSSGFTGPLPSFKKLTKLEIFDLSFNKLTGPIPSDFLEEVKSDLFNGLSLEGNLLTGEVPALTTNKLVLLSNHFTSVSLSYCESFGVLYDQFQCDAVMCPIGTFHPNGRRQTPDDICASCPSNEYMGSRTCVTDDGESPREKSEKEILQRFYSATLGHYWSENFGWKEESNHCLWKGIQCEQDQVVSIVLDDNKVEGVLPKEIFNLEKLRKLSLKKNYITVAFDGIENAKSLVVLDLSQTRISTFDGLEKATTLEGLYLNFNSIHSSFPTNILALTKLKILQLTGNVLTGNIPDLKELPDLVQLQLAHNNFQGQIPAFDLKVLKELNLSSNSLTGEIPPSISQGMPVLESLYLSNNKDPKDATNHPGLTGPIPNFELSPLLTYLDLSVNSLSAGISTDFLAGVSANEFQKLDLSDNELTGNVPNILDGFDVKMMNFVGNKFTSIDPLLCQRAEEGDCTHIMCSPKTFAENVGRHTNELACAPCPTMNNDYFGNTKCVSADTPQPTPSPVEIVPVDNGLTEEIILDKLYQVCGGQNWRHKDGWEDPSVPHCDRFGITCETLESGLSVTSIELQSNLLIGTPPIELYQLVHLKNLNFGDNDILFDFTDIERATNLEGLLLGATKIVSANGIKNAKNLRSVRLDQNNMVDFDLSEIYSLTKLQGLFLGDFKINGPFPKELTFLPDLGFVGLGNCGLTGELPIEIGLMKHMVFLELDHNALEGPIPTDLTTIGTLRNLDLSDNRLSGPLPSFSSLENFLTLDLSNNQLTGGIPEDFFQNMVPSKIEKIDLSDNKLTGAIAAPIARIVADNQLSQNVVDLTGNQFSSIDATVCVGQYLCQGIVCDIGMYNPQGRQESDELPCTECPTTVVLGAKDCDTSSPQNTDRETLLALYEATGGDSWLRNSGWGDTPGDSICDWEGITCTSNRDEERVQSISLSKNNLSGFVPMTRLLQMYNLEDLDLKGNDVKFSTTINSDEVLEENFDGIHSQIKILKLGSNQCADLSGIFGGPDGSGVPIFMDQLTSLDLEDCGISGNLPPQILKLTNLKHLDLSDNGLEGELPSDLIQFKLLEDLDLSNNNISGQLPEWINQLTGLEKLNLALNKIEGGLKNELASMETLVNLDLSNNQMAGPLIPLPNLKNLRSLDLASNRFTGVIPENLIGDDVDSNNWWYLDIRNNLLEGILPVKPFTSLPPDTFWIGDNKITGIPDELCNSPAAGGFGCDGILCPPGKYNEDGLATADDGACKTCQSPDQNGSMYFGATSCDVEDDGSSSGDGSDDEDDNGDLPDGHTDRDILNALFVATNGYSWQRLDNWRNDMVSICEWEGITCTDASEKQQVRSIDLYKNSMQGTVPMTKLLQLPYLEDLNLGDNSNLEVPNYINPTEVLDENKDGIRSNLKLLNLEDCRIYGNLAGIFGNADGSGTPVIMENLKVLNLADSGLSDAFPPQILKLTNLKELNLSDNDFEGEIPTGLSAFKDLKVLDLSDNEFGGEIPEWIGQLTELETLDLGLNALTGPMKNVLDTMLNLVYLSLSDNRLTGQLLPLENLKKINLLDLADNHFTGQVPANFLANADHQHMDVLDLEDNKLTGEVPLFPFNNFNPGAFMLNDNQFTAINSELCDTPAAGGHGCDGILCKPLTYNSDGYASADQECKSCESQDSTLAKIWGLSSCAGDDNNGTENGTPVDLPNGMTDRDILNALYDATRGTAWIRDQYWGDDEVSICEWEGIVCTSDTSKEHVMSISLSKNNMNGMVPMTKLLQMPYLADLNLSDNEDLEFPDFIDPNVDDRHKNGIRSRLKRLNFADCDIDNLDGILGNADGSGMQIIMDDLSFLNLEDCGLDGQFPPQILKFTNLKELDLADNDFEGVIPDGLSSLKDIKILDLSDNDFEGEIPDWIGQLSGIEVLDLGDNSLRGPLKSALNTMTNLVHLSVTENELTGSMVSLKDLSKLKSVDFSSNRFVGQIPTDFLASINPDAFLNVDLSDNMLTGQVPAAPFKKLRPDTFWVMDNQLTSIDPELCDSPAAGGYGCDGIACPGGYYNDDGNANEDQKECLICNSVDPSEATFLGSSDCDDDDDDDDDDESESSEDEQDDDDDDDDNGKSGFDSERNILMKFYDSCNGQLWYHQNNWGGQSICNWEGVKCADSQTTVEEIVLGSNNIECVPPLELFQLPNLKKLSLYGNFITFSFYGISNAKKLEELSLDNTNPGTLNGLEKAPDSLKRLTLNKCGLDGSFPSEILNLVNLEYLSIARNSLTGSLPSLSNMINLNTLNVGDNELTGGLRDITFASNLKEIDLSGNNFDGTIPATFLNNLQTKKRINIDLSENLLTGTVPASLERFELLNIDLKDNFFSGVNDNLCKKNSWNDGLVGKYGCDAILCPKGYTADGGKQISEKGKCIRCAESEYYGDSKCFALSPSHITFTSWSIKVFAVGTTLFLTFFS